ncbi:capsule assembly Wzi family protein [Vibrio coralliilyticus]|uniref:capsule assembly Wzi family protein n=1 Tax=Vibrio coralliilyticus TaxID=190893 RepID=UPI001F612EC4|nr:capsule assembly Wzi family protein [Vibrio coralliilyticus]
MPRIERLRISISLTSILLISNNVYSSPWIEANDPFLRSTMVALSDEEILNGVTSTFPLRWSSVEGDKSFADTSNGLNTEFSHFNYALQTAKLNRGNRRFAMYGGNKTLANDWFGDIKRDKWAVEASYEHLAHSYAFRFNSSYLEYSDDPELSFIDSYIALNAGRLLLDVSMLPRWWGHGWNHSLSLATSGKDLDAGLSWIGDNTVLGLWNLNIVTSKLEDLDYDYRASMRYSSKLNSWLELGLTQHYWFEANTNHVTKNQKQSAVDVKLTLPKVHNVQHGLYAEAASAQKNNGLGAYLIGWSGHKSVFNSSLRIVVEYQSLAEKESQLIVDNGISDYLQSSYLNKNSWSFSSYLQLANDHQISVIVSTKNLLNGKNDQQEQYQLSYQLPALQGRIKLSADYVSKDTSDSEMIFGSKYEFRF